MTRGRAAAIGVTLLYLIFGSLAVFLPETLRYHPVYGGGEAMLAVVGGSLALWSLSMIPWIRFALGGKRLESRLVLTLPITVMALLSVWVSPPLSKDVYLYVAYGRQAAIYGASPYTQQLAAFMRDPIIAAGDSFWYGQTSLLGCLGIACFALVNLLGPNSGLVPLARTIKALWLVPYAWLGKILWTRWHASPDRAALVFACLANPMMLYFTLVEGHLDICVLPFLFCAIIAVENEDPVKAALALLGATCFKLSVFVVTPVCACWLWRKRPRKGVVFFLLFLSLYGTIIGLLGGAEWPAVLVQSKAHLAVDFSPVVPRIAFLLGMREMASIVTVSDGLFYLSVAGICLAVLTGRTRRNPFFLIGLTMAALYFTRIYVQPWYTLWFWPLFWLSTNSTRTILTSVALWTAATLFANLYWQPPSPWVVALAFMADMAWNHRRADTSRDSVEGLN